MNQEQNRHIVYSSLDKDKKEFRLVRILDDPEGIKCCMETFQLDDPPDYRAASYCWTDHAADCSIELNGEPFSIRPNLEHFLRKMHRERQFGWFFVDALCINQNDVEERSAQVGFMGVIYRNATEVFIWLGDDYLYTHYDHGETTTVAEFQRLAVDLKSTMSDLVGSNSPLPPGKRDNLDMAINWECIGSDYWTRLWIVQEILLAKSLRLWSGKFVLEWKVFETAINRLLSSLILDDNSRNLLVLGLAMAHKDVGPTGTFLFKASTISTIIRQRSKYSEQFQAGQSIPLTNFLLEYSGTECSLIHDKVFGFYGVMHCHISVDYAMPILELYLRYLAETFVTVIGVNAGGFGDKDNWIHHVGTCAVLARVLKFDPCETIITLIASFTLWVPLAHAGLHHPADKPIDAYISYTSRNNDLKYTSGVRGSVSEPFSRMRRRIKKKTVLRHLQSCRKRNSTISVSNDSMQAKTHRQWLDWMYTITLDVYTRMQLADMEGKKAVLAAAVAAFSRVD